MKMNVELPKEFEQQLKDSVIKVVTDTLGNLSPDSNIAEYMDKQQCATYLNISISTFNAWLKKEHIPFTLIGGSYRFKKSEVDKFMLSKQK